MPHGSRFLCLVGALALLGGTVPAAAQTTLTFDDLYANGIGGPITGGYGGFEWTNFAVAHRHFLPYVVAPGYYNGTVSGDYTAFNSRPIAEVFSSSPFTFHSAHLTSALHDGNDVTVRGFVGTVEIYTRSLTLSTAGPTLVTFGFANVDRVRFESSTLLGGLLNQPFVMDDAVFSGPMTVTPEPLSIALLGTGLAGLAAARRRRRNRDERGS